MARVSDSYCEGADETIVRTRILRVLPRVVLSSFVVGDTAGFNDTTGFCVTLIGAVGLGKRVGVGSFSLIGVFVGDDDCVEEALFEEAMLELPFVDGAVV